MLFRSPPPPADPPRAAKRPRTADSDSAPQGGEGEMRPPSSRSHSRSPADAPPPTERRPSVPPPNGDRRPPLEPSIFMVEPIDEFTKEVADWLWGFCRGLDPAVVEVSLTRGVLGPGGELMRSVD